MKRRSQEIVDIYKKILVIIFDRLSPTFGQRTIAAIAKNTLAREAKTHQFLTLIAVSEQGVDWMAAEAHLNEYSDEQISAALEVFLDEFFEALSNLIGRLIMGKLFKEAEEMAKGGGAE